MQKGLTTQEFRKRYETRFKQPLQKKNYEKELFLNNAFKSSGIILLQKKQWHSY